MRAGNEQEAKPTFGMIACMRCMVTTGGRLIRRTSLPAGWQVITGDWVFRWFPTRCGNGLVNRGYVDDAGYLTESGRREL